MRKTIALLAASAMLAIAGTAQAADHEIKMLNKGDNGIMVFQPDLVKAEPGDTIHFVAVDKVHNAELIKGMIPDGAESFKGPMGHDLTVTLTKEGVYGVKCAPHYGMGMVALIVVGKPVNLQQAEAVPQMGRAKKVFGDLFAKEVAAK